VTRVSAYKFLDGCHVAISASLVNVGETNYTEITQRPSDLAIITFITSLVPA
jgi:hypothetical protein